MKFVVCSKTIITYLLFSLIFIGFERSLHTIHTIWQLEPFLLFCVLQSQFFFSNDTIWLLKAFKIDYC